MQYWKPLVLQTSVAHLLLVTEEDWQAICRVAIRDAKSASDGPTRSSAREWVAKYLVRQMGEASA